MSGGKARRWVFTLNNPEISGEEFSEYLKTQDCVKWYVFQLEKAPTTGTLHFQGAMGFSYPKRMKEVKIVLRCPHAHVEVMKAKKPDYCMKEDTRQEGPWMYGTPTSAGTRSDIVEFVDAIKKKATNKQLLEEYPDQFVKYNRVIEAARAALQPDREEPPTVILFTGPPGCGKTAAAKKYAQEHNLSYYLRAPHKAWFQGYDFQDVCILDEVDKYRECGMSWGLFLRLIDRYEVDVELKGASKQLTSKVIIMTAIKDPEYWFSEENSREQIERRITHWHKYLGDDWVDFTPALYRHPVSELRYPSICINPNK